MSDKEKQMETYDVSVIVLIYEQPKEKILLTLASIVRQKGIKMQIVVADDGSKNSYMPEIKEFFDYNDFFDYKVVNQKENVGTVKNCLFSLREADGQYVKFISPGDCFTSDEVLHNWIADIKEKKVKLSFCDSVYYQGKERFECISEVIRPQAPWIYSKSKARQKKYHLLYNDVFLGASLVSERVTTLEYLNLIENKILYGEDNIYRFMILDEIPTAHFNSTALYYEWGSGVSTAKDSSYLQQIRKDWETATEMMESRCGRKLIDKTIKIYYMKDEKRKSLRLKMAKFIIDMDIRRHYHGKAGRKRLTQMGDLEYLYVLSEMVLRGKKNEEGICKDC